MATVYDPIWHVQDASGNAIVGAKLWVYDAGTSNLSSLYTNTGLSIAAPNPLTSAATGDFPQFYLAEGGLYDVKPKNSDGTTLNRDALSVSGLGSQTGALVRDLTGSRFQVYNSGSVVQIETGDASPDNIGGTARMGGWSATQGDSLSLDYATVSVTGRLKEQGYKISEVVRTDATTWAAASSVNIALPNDPTGCRAWEVNLWDLVQSTNANIRLRLSYDNAVTFKSGAADYWYTVTTPSGPTAAVGVAQVDLTVATVTAANQQGMMTLRINGPNSGSNSTLIRAQTVIFDNGTTKPFPFDCAAYGVGGYGRPTHLQILMSAGTIAGSYSVRARRGFGET